MQQNKRKHWTEATKSSPSTNCVLRSQHFAVSLIWDTKLMVFTIGFSETFKPDCKQRPTELLPLEKPGYLHSTRKWSMQ